MPHALVLWLLAWSLAAGTALAEPVAPVDRNLFAFGGRMTAEAMPKSVNIPGVSYEDNGILGIGIQRWTWRGRHLDIGYEGGLAHRFGRDTTTEAWAGIGIRCCRYRLMRDLVLTPSIIFGLSYVDAAHLGRETEQVARDDGDAQLLFYLSPELELAAPDTDWSVFWRLHHRSGGGQTLGNMRGATNANVVGLRLRF